MFLRDKKPGFTLAELLFAVFLTTALFIALLSLQTSVISSQYRMMSATKLSGDDAYTSERMKQDLRSASVIVEPASGGSSSVLKGYINVSPLDPSSRVIPNRPASYFIYCTAADGKTFYRYGGSMPAPLVLVPFLCGNAANATQTRETLISAADMNAPMYMFFREANSGNVIREEHRICSGKENVSGKRSMQIQGSL